MYSNSFISNIVFYAFSALLVLLSITLLMTESLEVFSFELPISSNYYLLSIELLALVYILFSIKVGFFSSIMLRLVLIWAVWVILVSVIVGSGFDNAKYASLIEVLFWPSCFLIGYTLSLQSFNINKTVVLFVFIDIITLFLCYQISVIKTSMVSSEIKGFTESLNYIFFPMLTLPWLFLIRNSIIRNILLIVNMLGILLSAKRSAFICGIVILLWYVIHYYIKNKDSDRVKKIFSLVVFLVFSSVLIFSYLESTNYYIITRIESVQEDKGSGRELIYANVLSLQKNSNIEYWICGHGHNAVIEDNLIEDKHFSAHNDFLEVMYDYGLLGLILYLTFHFLLIKRVLFLRKSKSDFYFSYLSSYIIFIVMSAVSHLILYASFFSYLTLFWGSIEGFSYINSYQSADKLSIETNEE